MNNLEIFANCSERFKSMDPPTEIQSVVVIQTPFLIRNRPILLGKRHQGHLIALFPNEDGSFDIPIKSTKLSNGFFLSLQQLRDPKTGERLNFLELSNNECIDQVLFGALLDELLKIIDENSKELIKSITQIIDKWKNMLALDSERILSTNAIIGLFGELLLLHHLVLNLELDVFSNWVGPLGNRHDFEFSQSSIEVKSTTMKNKDSFKVNSLEQLEAYPGKEVYVMLIKLEVDPSGISIPKLLNLLISSSLISENSLYEKLQKIGYKKEHSDSYEKICFQPIEFQLIPIDSNFPRIKDSDLRVIDPAARIGEIEYEVNVTGLSMTKSFKISDFSFKELI